MALPSRLGPKLLLGALLGLLFYVALAVWSDIDAVGAAWARMPWWTIPAACVLSLGNYLVRFWKWQHYLRLLEIPLERRTSLLIYLSGLSMSVTPGKMGEVFKSWLLRKVSGTRIHKSAPIVVAERFTDLLGYLILIAVGGIATKPDYAYVFWLTLSVCVVALFLVGSERFVRAVLSLIGKFGPLARLVPRLEGAFESTRILLAPKQVLGPTLVSVLGWGLECTGFWLVANAVVPDSVPYLFAVYAFALAAVVGAIAVIFPGGLGITEGLLGTLIRPNYQPWVKETLGLAGDAGREVARAQAACAVIVARLCTLWFAVLVGLIATAIFTRRFGEVDESSAEAEVEPAS